MLGPAAIHLREGARRLGDLSAGPVGGWAAGLFLAGALFVGCPKSGGEIDVAVTSTVTQMGYIENAIELFASEEHRAPTAREGLSVLFEGTSPKDAWGNEYVYVVPGPEGRAYDLVSRGSDGREGGRGTAADLVWSEIDEPQPPVEQSQ